MSIFLFAVALLEIQVGGGIIQGTVLNHLNEGVAAARVEVAGGPQGSLFTHTDDEGRFAFSNLPPGRYYASVKKEGYVRQEYGQKTPGGAGAPIVIAEGTPSQNVVFRLTPASTLVGAVRTEEGFPIANILVQALRRGFGLRGERVVTVFSNALTNDLGEYRLYWIDPGDYSISATYLPQLPTLVNANEEAPRIAYAPTYYPGFNNPADAGIVQLDSGKVIGGIDFRLQPSPAVRVRGTVYSVLSNSAAPSTVTLMSQRASAGIAHYTTRTDETGAFDMKGIPAGFYVLSATSLSGDGQAGFAAITVADTDYSGANIAIGPGVTLSVRFFGEAPSTADFRAVRLSLKPLETFLPIRAASAMQPGGVLVIANVQPGGYLLDLLGLPDAAYVRSARSGQRDLLEQFVQVQHESAAPLPLDIQLAFDGGQITGAVSAADGRPADRATVVLIPDPARRHRPDQYRVVTSGTDGAFSISGIPPRAYKLFAWDTVEPNAWLNPDFIRGYEEFGAEVIVGASKKISAGIRVAPERR